MDSIANLHIQSDLLSKEKLVIANTLRISDRILITFFSNPMHLLPKPLFICNCERPRRSALIVLVTTSSLMHRNLKNNIALSPF